ncbi:bifunctional RNase H/acid phosphatase [Aeromicrobium sp.]|uniref:bifunctional RNase H/acid phosphatase n=1 Tax=Aeromicrobium sp. TaxID=1871063 RepID=UPI003D6AE717
MSRRVIIEADGGSRGNPGPAAYGALVRDADTGEVIAERGESIGIATNNVAEYRGLIAGLELVREHAPDAEVEVRMDSKLVVEQMAGRWKIKHADMKPLALQAQRLVSGDVTWTWVPRESNKAADALVNEALDSATGSVLRVGVAQPDQEESTFERLSATWRMRTQEKPTTVIMLRHGVTEHTVNKVFSGLGGDDPGLTDLGREQAHRAAARLTKRGPIDAIVSSPLRRTRETADVLAAELDLEVQIEPGFAEAGFGDWDGYNFLDIMERWPDHIQSWLDSPAVAPPGGESLEAVFERVDDARARLLSKYEGQTVVLVTHVTPIKMMLRSALDADMTVIHRFELAPASVTTIQWWSDGWPVVVEFSVVPD